MADAILDDLTMQRRKAKARRRQRKFLQWMATGEKDIELFPDDGGTEVIINPTEKQTELKLQEALNKVLKRVIMRRRWDRLRFKPKLRPDANDGIVPLKATPLTKEQMDRLSHCHTIMVLIEVEKYRKRRRLTKVVMRPKLKEHIIRQLEEDPILAREILDDLDIDLKR